MENVLFKERQVNTILFGGFVVIFFFFLYIFLDQTLLRDPLSKEHREPVGLLLSLMLGSLILAVFIITNPLKLTISNLSLRFSYGLLARETEIDIKEVQSLTVREYDALREFLGWGVRFNNSERCYTVSGNIALEIILKNNSKILIGTQKPQQLRLAIEKLIPNET